MKPRAKTEVETKKQIVDYLKMSMDYWEGLPNKTIKERLHGMVFSMLVMLDGESWFPCMDIIIRPHVDDKEYQKGMGNNWFPSGLTLKGGDLHELWSKNDNK